MKKIILVVLDGLGDEPIPSLNNKTPLEAARTPNFDWLAKNGVCGLVEPNFTMAIPTSEEGHFSLFGYDPKVYKFGRGIFTARGAGLRIKKGDVALRGNFATVDKNLKIIDRRAGRIKETKDLIKALNTIKIDKKNFPSLSVKRRGVKVFIKSAREHRVGIVLRGKGLSPNISDGDPFYAKLSEKAQKIVPLDKTPQASFTAKVLNDFLRKSHQILENHRFNQKRKKKGLLPANYLLVRGASTIKKFPTFREKYKLKTCCIAGKLLYQQIGKILGMKLIKVKGANGLFSTNLKGKIQAAKKALLKYDFIFLHIKATDSLAEDGNFLGKKEFIEKIDKNLKILIGRRVGCSLKNVLIVVTADHSTCSLLKRHCSKPIPILIFGGDKDSVKEFSESACQKGELGKIKQLKLMRRILTIAKK